VQTGHVERFNRAIRAALPYVDAPRFIESDRLALFNPRGSDVAVVLDLMIHDIDLVHTLVGGSAVAVAAVGVPVLTPFVDIANARLSFDSGAVANITASRVSRERMRKLRIFQQSGYLSLDLGSGEGEFFRLRGDGMRDAGVQLVEHVEKLAVMGFVEVLKHVPLHYRLAKELRRRIASGSVAVVVLIDYPGFNMKIAAAAKQAGVPVMYYITPQVWAWGAKRLPELARTITKAAVILPFEEALLREHGIDATFVGHPLLDRAKPLPDRAAARA